MKRHQARATAFKMLFQIEVGKNEREIANVTLEEAIAEKTIDPRDTGFISDLVDGVLKNREELDAFIRRYSQGWNFERINPVEKNILRIALYEIWHKEDIPFRIAINEAIELAKEYGDQESGAFVNGILDNVNHDKSKIAAKVKKEERSK